MRLLTIITSFFLSVVAYHYLLYGVLMKVWASLRPHRQRPEATALPPISLIVSAYNETAVIAQKIENSLALTYPADKLEIIIISDGSDDETAAIAQSYADTGITLMHDPVRRGKSAAMNRAAAQASGDILLFSDANAFYYADVLHKIGRHFADETVGCVSGNKTIRQNDGAMGQSAGLYWRYESAIKEWESAIGSTPAVVGEMLAIRRDCFTPIPAHIINDDAFLATDLTRRGWRVLYDPEAICWETAVVSAKDEHIRRRRINAGRYQLLFQPKLWPWRYPLPLFQLTSHKLLRLLLPFFMIGAFVSNLLLVWRKRPHWFMKIMLMGQTAVYLLALIGSVLSGKGGNGRLQKLPTIAHYIVSGNIASLHGLARYLTGKQTVLWDKAARESIEAE